MKTISYYHLHIKSFLTLNAPLARKFPFKTQTIESYDYYDYNVLILLKRPSQSSLAFISFLYRLSLAEGICFVIVFLVQQFGAAGVAFSGSCPTQCVTQCAEQKATSPSLSLFFSLFFCFFGFSLPFAARVHQLLCGTFVLPLGAKLNLLDFCTRLWVYPDIRSAHTHTHKAHTNTDTRTHTHFDDPPSNAFGLPSLQQTSPVVRPMFNKCDLAMSRKSLKG